MRADLLESYGQLYPLIEAGDVEAARALPAHQDFRARAAWLFDALDETEGIGPGFSLYWLAGWLAGHRVEEVEGLVRQALALAAEAPPERQTWRTASPGRSGPVEHTFSERLCPHGEMRDLMSALARAGVDVYVVSASSEPIVEAAAAALGFPLDAEHVFGVRLEVEGDLITTRPVPAEQYPFTFRQGKVELIRRLIGVEPLLVAGDADTDLEMLTAFPATEVRLVINRNKHDAEIGALYRAALRPRAEGEPLTLLQGRDEGRCAFQPLRETSPLGEAAPRPIPTDDPPAQD